MFAPEPEPEPETEPDAFAIVPFSYANPFTNPRLLPSRQFELHGRTVEMQQKHQKDEMKSEWDAGGSLTGAAVWDSSFVLAAWLPSLGMAASCRVLEVGAGAGLLAITAAQLGAEVTATDADDRVLSLLADNATLNGAELRTTVLAWGNDAALQTLDAGMGGWDIILAADCIYPGRREEGSGGDKPLLQTLRAACELRLAANQGGGGGGSPVLPPTRVVLGYKTRSAEQLLFFSLATRAGFTIEWVSQAELHPDFQVKDCHDDPRQTNVLGGVHVCVMTL